MLNPLDMIHGLCSNLDPALVERHLRRMPAAYFERYSAADIARHIRLLAELTSEKPIAVEVRPLGAAVYEVVVGCGNLSGSVACVTTALAADRFDLVDVQIASYEEAPDLVPPEPSLSVIQLRVSGPPDIHPTADLAVALHARLTPAFAHLAEGQFLEAQAAAAATGNSPTVIDRGPNDETAVTQRPSTGLVLGGDYRLERRLASGGMSEIFLATQISLDREVALKIAREESSPDSDVAARFAREAVVLAQFTCPYIVPVLAAGAEPSGNGVLGWIAMEYEAGGDLARWLDQQGPPALELGLRWFRQALEALRYAHRNAVLHRDLKPHNLLLTGDGNVKVGDFGLFKRVQTDIPAGRAAGAVHGTPHYMSPEQARGEHLDERTDIFSLGTTFFHVFSGRLPFDETSPIELMRRITHGDAPRLTDTAPHLPVPLAVILGRMLARRRSERYQDVSVIIEDLASYESRGLLQSSESGAFMPVPAVREADSPNGGETQAYVPALDSDG
jgi:Protein kinase domain